MQLSQVILRTISVCFFCRALYQIWNGLEGFDYSEGGQERSKKSLYLHLVFLFIYITCEVFSLIFIGKHKRYHNVYFDISWILWDISGMINYIIMLVITEMLYQSFQETYHAEEEEESDEDASAEEE